MAELFSDQQALVQTPGNSKSNAVNEVGAQVRVLYFSRLSTGASQNDTIVWGYLPKNARILRGVLSSQALGTGVTLAVGTDNALASGAGGAVTINAAATQLLGATAHASAAQTNVAVTLATGAGALTTDRTKVYVTVGGANPDAGAHIHGWIEYLAVS